MDAEKFHEEVKKLVRSACEKQGAELRSRQVLGLIEVMTGLVYGLAQTQNELGDVLARLMAIMVSDAQSKGTGLN